MLASPNPRTRSWRRRSPSTRIAAYQEPPNRDPHGALKLLLPTSSTAPPSCAGGGYWLLCRSVVAPHLLVSRCRGHRFAPPRHPPALIASTRGAAPTVRRALWAKPRWSCCLWLCSTACWTKAMA